MGNNLKLRNLLNIPTIESKLKYRKYKTFLTWMSTMSIAYLNNKKEIEDSLEDINKKVELLKNKIIKYKEKNNIFDKNPENPIQQQCCKIKELDKKLRKTG